MPSNALLLTSWYFPLRVVPWQTAIKMRYESSIDVLAEYGETVSSPSVTWSVPAVIRLRHKTPFRKKQLKYSDHNIKVRDAFTCQYCGELFLSHQLTMDHVVPRSQGGTRCFENIVAACAPCNHKKADKSCADARMYPRTAPERPRSLPIDADLTRRNWVPDEWEPYLVGYRQAGSR